MARPWRGRNKQRKNLEKVPLEVTSGPGTPCVQVEVKSATVDVVSFLGGRKIYMLFPSTSYHGFPKIIFYRFFLNFLQI